MVELRRACSISLANTLVVVNLLELQEHLQPQVPPEPPPDPPELPLTLRLASYPCYSPLSLLVLILRCCHIRAATKESTLFSLVGDVSQKKFWRGSNHSPSRLKLIGGFSSNICNQP
ncbi:unnamed protein product [Arabis nemorensis]|uniref:Uncharacterized protein n=1 Tax=Arabis nemorensis TaxID=586526 RepID=A0A565BGU6_9BRAS|nr:unnamed protein product [Arabis nemorensis]